MKILVVAASVGAGHMQAAKALAKALIAERPGCEVMIEDFLADSGLFGTIVKDGYLKMLSMAPAAYDALYRLTDRHFEFADFGDLMELSMLRTMRSLYRRHRPDMMIFTHPFPCAGAAFLKRHRLMHIPCAAVVTDLVAHRLWLFEEIEYYFVADQSLHETIEHAGIQAHRIFSTGIPIRSGFYPDSPAGAAARTAPLSLLLMGGGLGLGEVDETIKQLSLITAPLNIMVVAGRNNALRRNLNKMKTLLHHPLKVYGFTEQIHNLMQTADVLITKPGGLTCSEALASGLPMILTSALPGQEQDNARKLTEIGAAVWAQTARDVADQVAELICRPTRLQEMRAFAQSAGKPDAARDAAHRIIEILDNARGFQRAN